MSLLLVDHGEGGRQIALLKAGKLLEYRQDDGGPGPRAEAIYLGKVSRVMKALGAVFVRLSADSEGFLPVDRLPAGRQPRPGDSLLVQVKRPPHEGKAAYLTADIALPGQLVLLLPLGGSHHVSKRVGDEGQRRQLLSIASRIAPAGMALVMREGSLQAEEAALAEEVAGLVARWQVIEAAAQGISAPALLDEAPDALSQLLRELKEQPGKLISDRPEAYAGLGLPVEGLEQPFQLYDIQGQLQKALRRRQLLKSGASLVIDPCEAMTVIDVNTAHSLGGKDREQAILRTNLEAAQAIPRLLRLRGMAGIILIDFIDMPSEDNRQRVLEQLEQALLDDPVKTVVHGFTRLGMVEMTRRRAQQGLSGQALRRCPHCGGRGYLEEEQN